MLQVIYFHFPKFARQPQIGLMHIPSHPMNMLPLIRELLPDIPVMYDDDSHIPGLTAPGADAGYKWIWLISCGAVFLVDVAAGGAIFRSDDCLTELVCFLLQRTNRLLIVTDDNDDDGLAPKKRRRKFLESEGGSASCMTDHGHVVLDDIK